MRVYLDHASTSPVRPEAMEAMLAWLAVGAAADPGRVHTEGRMARAALEHARSQVAALLGARPREVVFTSGATEAINAAGFGAAAAAGSGGGVVLAAVEHSAVRDSAARAGGGRTVVGVDAVGRVSVEEIAAAVVPGETALVHIQWGNHEVGTVQPVAAVVAACRAVAPDVLVHVDAAAAAGHVPIDFGALGADLLSVSGHKLGAPPGTGALLVRRGLRLAPLLVGGEQERARRAGFENVPALIGFGAACAAVDVPAEGEAQRALTEQVLVLARSLDGVTIYGDPVDRLPQLVCLGVEGVEAEAVLLGLDQAGVAAHSGSACSSESLEPSPVLEAMGAPAERSLRVSVGWPSNKADIDALKSALPKVIERLRSLSPN